MYQHYFKEFIEGHKGIKHFAAHSHHFWPDVSLEGQIKAWKLASLKSDLKWNSFFSETYPNVQKFLAKMLNIKDHEMLAFSANTHDLFIRVISLLDFSRPIKILTTDGEFHSFKRQISRLKEDINFEITYLKVDDQLEDKINVELAKNYDLVFFSHGFFQTGKILDLKKITPLLKKNSALKIIDGYHAVGATPIDLSELEGHIFYLGGGYKYLMSGEGICYMLVPEGNYRPKITGWFADISHMEAPSEKIEYDSKARAFLGSTIDPTPFYRFEAIWTKLYADGITIEKKNDYIKSLMQEFIKGFAHKHLLYTADLSRIGHFLTLILPSPEAATSLGLKLHKHSIVTDTRNRSVRIGFGLYHSSSDVKELVSILNPLI